MKFCYNTNFTLPKQSQRSRSILQDGSRSLRLFWKEKTLSYNRRNTVFIKSVSSSTHEINIKLIFLAQEMFGAVHCKSSSHFSAKMAASTVYLNIGLHINKQLC